MPSMVDLVKRSNKFSGSRFGDFLGYIVWVCWMDGCKLREFLWVLGIVEGVDWTENRDICVSFLQIMLFLQDKRMAGFSFLSRIKGIICWYREQIKDFL